MKRFIPFLVLLILSGCRSTSRLEVVDGFEVTRYLGKWYEVARYPHRFEDGMSSVSATYRQNDDGTIRVINRGFLDEQQQWKEIEGVAKFKGDHTKGWLKVSFFKPFYASYKIIYLDPDYSKAIVTGPTYGYLWILARNPVLPESEIKDLVQRAERVGFDPDNLIMVSQDTAE